jgi:hypothetical protein
MENIQLKIENTAGEIVIRQGKTLDLKEPNAISITGDISSVAAFLCKRAVESGGVGFQAIDKAKALLIVDKKEMSILLMLDPENFYGAKVKGTLELSDELKIWGINSTQTFTREALVKLIRFNKLHFDNKDKHEELLRAYQTLNVQAIINSQQESDQRGNKKNNFEKNVTTNVPTEFILSIPIFKGQEARTFRAEICLDVTDGGARFWFESVELHELVETLRDVIMNEQLKAADGFVIINK